MTSEQYAALSDKDRGRLLGDLIAEWINADDADATTSIKRALSKRGITATPQLLARLRDDLHKAMSRLLAEQRTN